MVSLVIFSHQGHHPVSLAQVLVMLSSCGPRLLNQCGFLLLKLCRVTCLDKSHVIHLVLDLANGYLGVTDVGLSLPVSEDSN